ncbi:glyoxalase/dioxygenase superfamily protein [Rhizodiscina lignyota]|uniref:Glyoxalase/dioxygenase superfamily protein n=1 Tax=Rhizodiscina lignyota TaxID=1504668 RepID=A0A9P4I1Y3_9PEZI|nr:glyoxalase/dioxygenase superfamily protein [Rhizodiscina lignyota]
MKLNQVTVPVKDINRSIAFYKILGLNLIVHTNEWYARFECPDDESTFSLHRVNDLPSGDGVWVYFEVPNVDAKVEELQQEGIEIEEAPEDKRWLWREARLRDPDRNVIIVYHAGENRKNPPWRL